MHIGVRQFRNHPSQVIEAVRAGERVTLTIRGKPVADIVPYARRTRWLSGSEVRAQLAGRGADAPLTRELGKLSGRPLDG